MENQLGDQGSEDLGLKRRVTPREASKVFIGVSVAIGAIVLTAFGYRWIGYLAIGAFGLLTLLSWRRMTPADKFRISKELEQQERSLFGRVGKLVEWLVILGLVYAAFRWFAGKV